MRTKEEFIKRWKAHVTGLIAIGSAQTLKFKTGPIGSLTEYGQHLMDISETSETLLSQLWFDVQQSKPVPIGTIPPNKGIANE